MTADGKRLPAAERRNLEQAVTAILEGYSAGTRYGIRMDASGLLDAGVPGVQLTWMDAKVGDWVVTPRIGKPVEIQALWINALRIGARLDEKWSGIADRATAAFGTRFWNEASYLYDVVDNDGRAGAVDSAFRPNQLFAIGGLPWPVLDPARGRAVVDAVEARLWTPMGPRSLAPGEPGYAPRYQGGPVERDGSYHQGTVWPWLAGAFIEAWIRVRGSTPQALAEARERFFDPLLTQLERAGLGHLAEIADAEPPHTPRGCPFQAWSMGELLRLDGVVLAAPAVPRPRRATVSGGAR
jgi:glycogen debranching enzyme